MIKLLSGHSLTAKDRFRAEKFALNLAERDSTATITIGPEAPAVAVGDWIQDEDEPGAGIVWRVKSIDEGVETETRTLNCEHVVTALKDRIIFGDIQPSTIAGKGKTSCTAEQAARYVLSHSGEWVLGTFGFSKSAPYNFNSDDLFEALETVSSSLMSAWWSYDFSVFPFRLNITPQETAAGCEMRMSRNIRTLKKSIDRSRMYTRFYPIGKNNMHLGGTGYLSRNENLYGIISRVETDTSLDTQAKLQARAEERLNNHAEPLVTVTISGMDLSAATGEPLDKLTLGKVCRVPLPEYGTTIQERIIKLSWADKVRDPESVTVTMANQKEDVANIINNIKKSAKKSSKNHAKQSEADHAWMVDTDEHIGLVAEAVAGEGASSDWSRVSSIMVDGQGIHQRVQKAEGQIVTAYTLIDANENRILLEAQKRETEDGKLSGRITVEADRITQEVTERKNGQDALSARITVEKNRITQEVTDRTNADATLSGRITVEAERITAEVTRATTAEGTLDGKITVEAGKITQIVSAVGKDGSVTAASIVLAINESSGESEAKIDAQKVYIGNEKSTTVISGKCSLSDVTASYISGKIATVASLTTQAVSGTDLSFNNCYAGTFKFRVSSGSGYAYTDFKDLFVTSLSLTQSGDTYTLSSFNANATETVIGTFSRATSLSGVWGGVAGRFKVTASPQGNEIYTDLSTQGHWGYAASEDPKKYYGGISATINGGVTSHTTGAEFVVDATDIYNEGHDSVVLAEIDLNGSSAATSPTKPTTALNKTPSTISGYKWIQLSDGTWKNLGAFSIATNAGHFTTSALYYLAGGTYHKVNANTLVYSDL
jgi:phage minor structural protein